MEEAEEEGVVVEVGAGGRSGVEVVKEVEGAVVGASVAERVAGRAGEVVESAAVAQGAAEFRLSDLS